MDFYEDDEVFWANLVPLHLITIQNCSIMDEINKITEKSAYVKISDVVPFVIKIILLKNFTCCYHTTTRMEQNVYASIRS